MSDEGGTPDRKFGAIMLGVIALAAALLALTYMTFSGSSGVARAFSEALRQGKDEEAGALCEPEARAHLAALSWLRGPAGSVEVDRGVAGLWHQGFVPYACHELRREKREAWIILLRREGVWRVREISTGQRPEACEPEP